MCSKPGHSWQGLLFVFLHAPFVTNAFFYVFMIRRFYSKKGPNPEGPGILSPAHFFEQNFASNKKRFRNGLRYTQL